MRATLSLTHRCNLACRYCYSGRAAKPDMSVPTARAIVDFVLGLAPPGPPIEMSFFGGEPLLCFDLIQATVGYIRQQERETGHSVALSITTNGTLLPPAALDFFKAEQIDLCISLDGPPAVHNAHRVYRNGRGSFARVLRGLEAALNRLGAVQVNAVYGPDTLPTLPVTVAFFAELGVPAIHLNPDIRARWGANVLPVLPDVYQQIADYYIERYRHGQELAINLLDSKLILFLKGGYSPCDRCGMGETEWGFAPSGNIYPCERFIGEDDSPALCLGNIHTGLDPARRRQIISQRGNRTPACQDCPLRAYCMNWCGCTNYFLTGYTDLAGPFLCVMEQAAIRAAEHVFITLSEQGNDLFVDHLLRYVQEGRHVR